MVEFVQAGLAALQAPQGKLRSDSLGNVALGQSPGFGGGGFGQPSTPGQRFLFFK